MTDEPSRQSGLQTRHVVAAVAGNALEFYDFTTYAFYAAQIGRAFFPSASATSSLLASLATFGAGFVTRPLGAVALGSLADRVGRKPAMLISFGMMGLALLALGACPSYASIGIAAPIVAIVARLAQGFALGGEVGPTTSFLLEAAPKNRRGLYTAFQSISQNAASVVAGLLGFGLSASLNTAQMDAYGWRIAILVGTILLPFGLWVRSSMPETLHDSDKKDVTAAQGGVLSQGQLRVVLCSLAILIGGTVATYIQLYLTTYTEVILHMKVKLAFGATIAYGVVGIFANIAGALFSERYGRRVVMIAPRLVLMAAIFPAFWMLAKNRDLTTLLSMTAVLTLCASLSGGAMMGAIAESLKKGNRALIFSIVYAAPIVLLGGATQYVATKLITLTGDILAPAYFYMVATFIALVGMFAIRESAPAKAEAQPS